MDRMFLCLSEWCLIVVKADASVRFSQHKALVKPAAVSLGRRWQASAFCNTASRSTYYNWGPGASLFHGDRKKADQIQERHARNQRLYQSQRGRLQWSTQSIRPANSLMKTSRFRPLSTRRTGNALNISAEGRSASFQGDTHLKKQAAGLFEIWISGWLSLDQSAIRWVLILRSDAVKHNIRAAPKSNKCTAIIKSHRLTMFTCKLIHLHDWLWTNPIHIFSCTSLVEIWDMSLFILVI